VIVLADVRYGQSKVQRKLPQWIQPRLTVAPKFGQGVKAVHHFFADKKH